MTGWYDGRVIPKKQSTAATRLQCMYYTGFKVYTVNRIVTHIRWSGHNISKQLNERTLNARLEMPFSKKAFSVDSVRDQIVTHIDQYQLPRHPLSPSVDSILIISFACTLNNVHYFNIFPHIVVLLKQMNLH